MNASDIIPHDQTLKTPLHYAARYNRNENVTKVIATQYLNYRRGAIEDFYGSGGATPLADGVFGNAPWSVIKVLIELGANVNSIISKRAFSQETLFGVLQDESLLFLAVKYNTDERVITGLLDAGVNLQWRPENRETVLNVAAHYNTNELIIEELLKRDVFEFYEIRRALVTAVVDNPNPSITEKLLTVVMKNKAFDDDIESALLLVAIDNENSAIFELLYSKFGPPADAFNWAQLIERAIEYNREDSFLRLLENAPFDFDFCEILMYACIAENRPNMFITLMRVAEGPMLSVLETPIPLRKAGRSGNNRLISLLTFFGADATQYFTSTYFDRSSPTATAHFLKITNARFCQRLAFDIIKEKATEICIALQSAGFDANRMLYILKEDDEIGIIATYLPQHYLDALITKVKHFATPRNRFAQAPPPQVPFATRQKIENAATAKEAYAAIRAQLLRDPNDAEIALIEQRLWQLIETAENSDSAFNIIQEFAEREPNAAERTFIAQTFDEKE